MVAHAFFAFYCILFWLTRVWHLLLNSFAAALVFKLFLELSVCRSCHSNRGLGAE